MLRENDKIAEAVIQLINAMPEKEQEKIADSTAKRRKKSKSKTTTLNGVTIIPADSSVNTSSLSDIFRDRKINSKQLRAEAWQRAK
ncbi:MAG: hypothetical protein SH857_19075 [Chitinophagales bacterium]|nr:hypothetical protein [Chitinophagales bacterium]